MRHRAAGDYRDLESEVANDFYGKRDNDNLHQRNKRNRERPVRRLRPKLDKPGRTARFRKRASIFLKMAGANGVLRNYN